MLWSTTQTKECLLWMSIDILHTSSDSFQACAGYIALKEQDKVECFLKQSLNGAILLEGCQGPAASGGKHRALSSTCISGWVTLSLHNGIPQLGAGRGFVRGCASSLTRTSDAALVTEATLRASWLEARGAVQGGTLLRLEWKQNTGASYFFAISSLYLHLRSSSSVWAVFRAGER